MKKKIYYLVASDDLDDEGLTKISKEDYDSIAKETDTPPEIVSEFGE